MYPTFNIGNRFRIVPPGTPPCGEGRIDLVIAKGAFGSGEHETTASCLSVLEVLPEVRGAELLDLGSGTGILAIGALALGARSAVCIDINPQAVETARRNCGLNGFLDRTEHIAGDLSIAQGRRFDLVLVNLYGDLLLDLAEGLVAAARPGATLLLSGMLWEYNYDVRALYEKLGCEVLQNRMLTEFSTVLLKKKE